MNTDRSRPAEATTSEEVSAPGLPGAFPEITLDEFQRTMEYPAPGTQSRHLDTSELAERRLRGRGYPALQCITCDFRSGVLTLRGQLPTYYLKQVALAAVAAVEGVERIDDQIEVATPPTEPSRARRGARHS
jgi:osmotically-inducible protein OsmY